jgi:hypothetical protein
VVDLDRDEAALGDALLPRCLAHPYVVRLTDRLRCGGRGARRGPRTPLLLLLLPLLLLL